VSDPGRPDSPGAPRSAMATPTMRYTPMGSEAAMDEGSAPAEAPANRGRLLRIAAPLALVGAVAAAIAHSRRAAPVALRGDAAAAQQKVGILAMAEALSGGLTASSQVVKDLKETYPDIKEAWGHISAPSAALKRSVAGMSNNSHLVNLTEMAKMTPHDLMHPKGIDRHDGSPCPGDEEAFEGLCYKKCADLTENLYPIRTTAWSCCHELPCSFFNSKFMDTLIPCHGFDVSGSSEGQGCPHYPGSCMPNEEFSLGVCYKKCAILTNNEFPFRSGADTCCRYNNHFACMDALNVKSSLTFDIGGGYGDHVDETPRAAHNPIPQLTEA